MAFKSVVTALFLRSYIFISSLGGIGWYDSYLSSLPVNSALNESMPWPGFLWRGPYKGVEGSACFCVDGVGLSQSCWTDASAWNLPGLKRNYFDLLL